MLKKLIQETHKNLTERLMNRAFLREVKMTKKNVLALMREEHWREMIQLILEQETVDCESVLELCAPAMKQCSAQSPAEGWLPYIYALLKKGLYPFSVEIEENAQFKRASRFFLETLRFFLEQQEKKSGFLVDRSFAFAEGEEVNQSAISEEYIRFREQFSRLFVYELMYLGRQIMPFNTLGHIAGVHRIAMHVARQMKKAGVPIDLALVSGAAAGHDLGKYGCRPQEEKRIPYLHYYYTDQWFKSHQMPAIGHIAANHSTWDLELENLSVESLTLIYADFRVKNDGYKDGKEQIKAYSLKESFQVILNKLDNVDEAKEKRYRHVYAKLADFERYMEGLGVNTDLSCDELTVREQKDPALLNVEEAVESLKYLAIAHNISVMNKISNEAAFGNILESARSEKNWKNSRAYVSIIEEYFTYMTQKQKLMCLGFLYELLMHREGDIRRQAANLMGNIIVHYDEEYRKELPEGIRRDHSEMTGFGLWKKYLEMIVIPDHKVTEQHKRWIGYTLKIVVESVLTRCKRRERKLYLNQLLKYYKHVEWDDSTAFILLDSMQYLPIATMRSRDVSILMAFAERMYVRESLEVRTAAMRFLHYVTRQLERTEELAAFMSRVLRMETQEETLGLQFLGSRIMEKWKLDPLLHTYDEAVLYEDESVVSDIFLENLKAATPWIIKSVNIEFLLERVKRGTAGSVLHVATHLSNLLKVSERVTVRHSAGEALLRIAPRLTFDQRIEVAIELTKGLEIGEYEFSKYIPQYLGPFVLFLRPQELDELLSTIRELLVNTNDRIVCVALDTLGYIASRYSVYRSRFPEGMKTYAKRGKRILGMLLSGLSNYRDSINQEALMVIGHHLFAGERLELKEKKIFFQLLYKKLVTMVNSSEKTELAFFNSAAALNHIYRFISDYLFFYGKFEIREPDKVAFFPGTYDPFSLGHKGIAKEIRDHGFLVYLALDEFSWSKKTQPRMIRRQIMTMSVSDEENIFVFPDDIPVNISNPGDLKRLRELFPGKEVYMVAGSDVVENASSYKSEPVENSIQTFPHVLFRRSSAPAANGGEYPKNVHEKIQGEVIELKLPVHLEDISSTRIRENIDLNRDISNLIDPTAQNYIYENNLYLREPQNKQLLQKKAIHIDITDKITATVRKELTAQLEESQQQDVQLSALLRKTGSRLLLIRDERYGNRVVAAMSFRHLGTRELYRELKSTGAANYIREKTSGKIVHINGVYQETGSTPSERIRLYQLLLTETLAYCLAKDFTYAVCNVQKDGGAPFCGVLERQGFYLLEDSELEQPVYVVDMKFPMMLTQNLDTVIKEPLNHNPRVLETIEAVHQRLQTALTALYPGNLVISFDAGIIHHKMVDMITRANQVPGVPLPVRTLGRSMCVPFGKTLRGMVVPNTVTKALHTEKVFEAEIRKFRISEYPNYSPLVNQIRTIKSFNRPVILVDDMLHKGYRIRELDPIFKEEKVEIDRIIVGVLSGRGQDLMDIQKRKVESVYFLPSLRSWFVESTIYPFIGGDMVERSEAMPANLLNSINFILPYVAPGFLRDVPKQAIYQLSVTCLENARDILLVLEEEYQKLYERNLTLSRLSEVIISPTCPDKGGCLSYDYHLAPSVYVNNDMEKLTRLRSFI